MRILHPKTLQIISERNDISKVHIARVWSEIFKWKGSGKSHPKMFIDDDYYLGLYLRIVYEYGKIKKCNLDKNKISKLSPSTIAGFNYDELTWCNELALENFWFDVMEKLSKYFDDNYLFSDACSLYYKGINIFPDIFGSEWRKYIPVESHKEIVRQCNKTLKKYEK